MIAMPTDTNSPTMVHVRRRIREEMEAKGVSGREVGEVTGVGHPGISRILNGHVIPRLDTLDAIARAIGVPVSRFFTGI